MNVEDSRTNEIHSYGLDEVNRELFLHGYFSNEEEELGVEYRMATTFVKNLRILDLDSSKNIFIHMHTHIHHNMCPPFPMQDWLRLLPGEANLHDFLPAITRAFDHHAAPTVRRDLAAQCAAFGSGA